MRPDGGAKLTLDHHIRDYMIPDHGIRENFAGRIASEARHVVTSYAGIALRVPRMLPCLN